jgi:hypothetical protein
MKKSLDKMEYPCGMLYSLWSFQLGILGQDKKSVLLSTHFWAPGSSGTSEEVLNQVDTVVELLPIEIRLRSYDVIFSILIGCIRVRCMNVVASF